MKKTRLSALRRSHSSIWPCRKRMALKNDVSKILIWWRKGTNKVNWIDILVYDDSTCWNSRWYFSADFRSSTRRTRVPHMLYNLYMDYVMRIFINACQKQNIRFLNLNYYIPSSVSRSNTSRDTTGVQIVDWSGYADDLLLFFEDEQSLCNGSINRWNLRSIPTSNKRNKNEINDPQ